MKASLKFREDRKPLLRAKVPLSVLGFPFQSGIVAGESKELTLNLATFFESGPTVKVSYRPNDTWNPFSLVVKTGAGSFGSPISSAMSMSAEFGLLGRGNPTFMLHFKPQFGDFSIKKSQSSSVFDNVVNRQDDDEEIEVVENPAVKKINVLTPQTARVLASTLSGIEVTARTALPLRSRAVVNFRWGVRFPADMMSNSNPIAEFTMKKIPFLVMNKIGIEHVDVQDSKVMADKDSNSLGGDKVGEACFSMKRQLEMLQTENCLLKRAVEDVQQEVRSISLGGDSKPYSKLDRRSGERKPLEADASEELKKALKTANSNA